MAECSLSALLLYYRKRKGFFDDYKLNDITYTFSPQVVYDKFESDGKLISTQKQNAWTIEEYVNTCPNSTPAIILKEFGYNNLKLDNDIARAGAAYLAYKVLSIASKYPSYNEYEGWNIKSFSKISLFPTVPFSV